MSVTLARPKDAPWTCAVAALCEVAVSVVGPVRAMDRRAPPGAASAFLPMYASVPLGTVAVACAPDTEPSATPMDLGKGPASGVASPTTLNPEPAGDSPPAAP